METFQEYFKTIEDADHRAFMVKIFDWIEQTFPNLERRIGWNQPMFTDHGTFIIGFSASKNHMSVTPEQVGMQQFTDRIAKAGYSQTKGLFRIAWNDEVDFDLLKEIIAFNIKDKADTKTFWRK